MKDRTRNTPAERRRTDNTPPTLPPLVAALFRLAEPNYNGVPQDFMAAYAAMPDVIATFLRGAEDKAGEVHLDNLITEISGLAKAREKAEKNPDIDQTEPRDFDQRHELARIVAILNRVNEDYPTDLTAPVGTAGLWVGMSFAAYVLTNGGCAVTPPNPNDEPRIPPNDDEQLRHLEHMLRATAPAPTPSRRAYDAYVEIERLDVALLANLAMLIQWSEAEQHADRGYVDREMIAGAWCALERTCRQVRKDLKTVLEKAEILYEACKHPDGGR